MNRGTFDNTGARYEKRVFQDRPVENRYVTFRAFSETHANPYTSVAKSIILDGE